MGRLTSLEFDAELHYEETPAGILVPIRLAHGNRSVELRARLDTGAADCIFDDSYAAILGLPDSGIQREYRTVAGSFKAHGHEVTIETLGLEWTALVFFHAMGNPAHAFVGRRGWLDRVRLGIVHYEQRLLLGQYGS
jgi:predicted aspartyl protease